MTPITVTIPGSPPSPNRARRAGSWHARAKSDAQWRDAANWAARAVHGARPSIARCDHGMLYRAVRVHSRIKRAVRDVLGVRLLKRGRMAKPQWSGSGRWCGDEYRGNRLPEGGATACARQGWGWRRIVRRYIHDVVIVEPSR